MERVILVLAMLAGLHLILSFLQSTVEALKGFFARTPRQVSTPEPVEKPTMDWKQYDIPAYMRRNGIGNDPGSKATASFEVIA